MQIESIKTRFYVSQNNEYFYATYFPTEIHANCLRMELSFLAVLFDFKYAEPS